MSSLNRRLLLGSALAALAVPFSAAAPVSAQTAGAVGICRLCQRLGRPLGANSGANATHAKLVQSSGDPETDRILGVALRRLAETFQVSPGFAFYDDHSSPGAFAVSETLAGNGPGTVLMGMRLFGQLMARVRDGGVTVISVCAHEFGHVYQTQSGYMDRLAELDRTDRPIELHADFLAGYYLGLRKTEHRELDLSAVGGVLYALGDTAFTARDHHGTPEERVGALAAGFKFGTQGRHDVSEAAKAGFQLIRRNS